MSAHADGITTLGMNDTMLEMVGKMYLGQDKLRNLSPYLMGMWLDALFLGALLALFVRWQVNSAATDKTWVELLVYWLVLLHLGSSGYTLAVQIHLFVKGFGEYKNFLNVAWSRPPFVFNAFSRVPAACFFLHRAWLMYKKNMAILIVIIPLLAGAAGAGFGVAATWTYMPMPQITTQLVITMASLELAADFAITGLLASGLIRSKTGWLQTDALIAKVLRLLIETQVPPTIVAALLTMTVSAWRGQPYIAYFNAGPKVHVICLLIVITSRIDLNRSANSHGGAQEQYMQDSIELASTTGSMKADQVRIDRVTHVTSTQEDPSYHKKSINRSPPSASSDVSDKEYTRDAKNWA